MGLPDGLDENSQSEAIVSLHVLCGVHAAGTLGVSPMDVTITDTSRIAAGWGTSDTGLYSAVINGFSIFTKC
jgi:hypothetical protein